jgi:anti-anti-sigma factor
MRHALDPFDTSGTTRLTESSEPGARASPSPGVALHSEARTRGKHVGQQSIIQIEIHSADAAIVSLSGEHDLESQPRVTAALTAGGVCSTVLADLSGCTFADSSVIAALLRAARQLREQGRDLQLVVGPEARSLRRTLEMMGVAALLPVHDSREAALAGLVARPPAASVPRAA